MTSIRRSNRPRSIAYRGPAQPAAASIPAAHVEASDDAPSMPAATATPEPPSVGPGEGIARRFATFEEPWRLSRCAPAGPPVASGATRIRVRALELPSGVVAHDFALRPSGIVLRGHPRDKASFTARFRQLLVCAWSGDQVGAPLAATLATDVPFTHVPEGDSWISERGAVWTRCGSPPIGPGGPPTSRFALHRLTQEGAFEEVATGDVSLDDAIAQQWVLDDVLLCLTTAAPQRLVTLRAEHGVVVQRDAFPLEHASRLVRRVGQRDLLFLGDDGNATRVTVLRDGGLKRHTFAVLVPQHGHPDMVGSPSGDLLFDLGRETQTSESYFTSLTSTGAAGATARPVSPSKGWHAFGPLKDEPFRQGLALHGSDRVVRLGWDEQKGRRLAVTRLDADGDVPLGAPVAIDTFSVIPHPPFATKSGLVLVCSTPHHRLFGLLHAFRLDHAGRLAPLGDSIRTPVLRWGSLAPLGPDRLGVCTEDGQLLAIEVDPEHPS
jgi:hypothetical protein